ncbi:MAG: hypothetical protein IJV71_05275, partial [Lachnospiraceae bacterium]|nr:hypothetical protein [Lachnospiraceae bacterium]
MRDFVRQVKKHWKLLTGLAVALTVSVVGMVMIFANNVVVTLSVSEEKTTWASSDQPPMITSAVSLPDGITIVDEKITWSSSNPEAVAPSAIMADPKSTQLVFNGAGKATIYCDYYMLLSDGSEVTKRVS